MLTRRGRWRLTAAAALMLLPVLSPDASLADDNRAGGTWTGSDDLTRVVTEYWHHNPWVCANPPTIGFDFLTGLPVEGDCTWGPGALLPAAPYETPGS